MGRSFGPRGFGRISQPTEEPSLANISWVKYDNLAGIAGQENVSSITYNGGGDHTVTWTRPFRTASSYAVTICSSTANAFSATTGHFASIQAITATSVRTRFNDYNSQSATDPTLVFIAAIGEF